MDQNGRALEIKDKLSLTLLINKQKCDNFPCSQEQENILNDVDFYHLRENVKKNIGYRTRRCENCFQKSSP